MLERYQTEVEMSPVAEGTQEVGDLNLLDIRKSSDRTWGYLVVARMDDGCFNPQKQGFQLSEEAITIDCPQIGCFTATKLPVGKNCGVGVTFPSLFVLMQISRLSGFPRGPRL